MAPEMCILLNLTIINFMNDCYFFSTAMFDADRQSFFCQNSSGIRNQLKLGGSGILQELQSEYRSESSWLCLSSYLC